jgi:acetyl/propionyl-CoA carboxylase alpha subunit
VDSGIEEGASVPVQYDPMLAKLVAYGEHRDAAIDRAIGALRRFPVLGVRTNIPFLIRVLDHPRFRAGDVHTAFVDEHLSALLEAPPPSEAVRAAAVFARQYANPAAAAGAARRAAPDPWTTIAGWGR